jgi:hypothetical protein
MKNVPLLEAVCRGSALSAEILAYGTIFAYIIIIWYTVTGRHPGAYLFMTTLPPVAIVMTKVPAAVGLITKHVTAKTAILVCVAAVISWVLQATYSGRIAAPPYLQVALCLSNIVIMLYFISTPRFSILYQKCQSGLLF